MSNVRLPAQQAVLTVLLLGGIASACTGMGAGGRGPPAAPVPTTSQLPSSGSSDGPAPDPAVSGPTTAGAFAPSADRAIPGAPGVLARVLERTDRSLRAAIDDWVASGRPSPPRPPAAVELLALYEQRAFRFLGRNAALARRTIVLLPAELAVAARANVEAAHALFSAVHPVPPGYVLRVQRPEPPGHLLGYLHEAQRRFGVDWQLLAAVMLVESKFGRARSASTAGAQGPMQFIPSTWAAYGLDGDVHDPHDAILGAANYLRASDALGDERRALFAYNHSDAYVDAVENYAGVMRRDPRAFFAYYNWQVFLVTTAGDRRLTGPGAP